LLFKDCSPGRQAVDLKTPAKVGRIDKYAPSLLGVCLVRFVVSITNINHCIEPVCIVNGQ
jgi:hypothetical protein